MQRRTKRRVGVTAGVACAFVLGLLAAIVAGDPLASRVESAAAAIGGAVGLQEDDGASDGESQERPPTRVTLAPVETGTARAFYGAVGEIAAERRVRVTSSVPGIVETIAVDDGARVAAGEVLVRLDQDQQQSTLRAAESAFVQAREALERTQTLIEDGFATEAEIERDRAAFTEARAAVERAREALDDRTVRAPFDGEIGIVAVDVGAYVRPGDMLANLASTDALVVRVSVPPAIASGLAPGDPVTVTGPAGEVVDARVTSISPLADPATRTVAVEASIAEPGDLRPGSFASVDVVEATREDALFVPAEAVVLEGQLAFVFVPGQDMAAERRRVEIGVRRDGRVEVREGLARDERVVLEGKQKLATGMPIAVAEESAGAGASEGAGDSAGESG
ncbi:efflux RND transporter periplasmic adaptor subunit [Salinarimonas ramus]|uniref:MexH family multidrug efflux RND transporter periplasmic adaptor subunit n=1 Tax=Salinarimonas ramus TaxID=690164 RepID=A0A917Q4P1_9HYPH|nr:efflux RND transporter periplasmic adaptor subunit [Salinarimonas ramus]GGK23363.1 MexH family multidrug efflux RND transporter periplasmic adaptor subunit [Salinarimonas ramus]